MGATVVNRRHGSAGGVYIGRPSIYGNPFIIGRDGNRDEVVARFRQWIWHQPELLRQVRRDLAGRVIECFCAPDACHGDVLAEIADGTMPVPVEPVFVFGSNLAGRHGAGAARAARLWYGAHPGQGEGLAGGSYALPTKDASLVSLPLAQVAVHVERFLSFARAHPDLEFLVTRVGCGLAGYADRDIAPLFSMAPANCLLPALWARDRVQGFGSRVIIAGSRSMRETPATYGHLDRVSAALSGPIVVISGGARGADQIGEQWALSRGHAMRRIPADWVAYGRAAGPLRNARMAWYGTDLVAFWDGASPGTRHMMDTARLAGLPVTRFPLAG